MNFVTESMETIAFHYKNKNINYPMLVFITLAHVAAVIGLFTITSCSVWTLRGRSPPARRGTGLARHARPLLAQRGRPPSWELSLINRFTKDEVSGSVHTMPPSTYTKRPVLLHSRAAFFVASVAGRNLPDISLISALIPGSIKSQLDTYQARTGALSGNLKTRLITVNPSLAKGTL